MPLHRKLPLSLALLGLVLSAPRAEANSVFNLDDFIPPLNVTCSPTCTSLQTGIPTANVLSGQREASATNAALFIGSGTLDYAGGIGGAFFARYAFAAPTDLIPLGNSFVFDVAVADGVTNQVELTVTDDTNSKTKAFTPVLGINEIQFNDADFAGIDFTKIEQVQFGLTNDDAHLRLGPVLVPEPSTAGMLLLGLLGLARLGRRARA